MARLTLICLSFLLFACNKKDAVLPPLYNPPAVTDIKKYLALGDSYTIGQSVPVADRFPVQTKKWLVENGVNLDSLHIIATSGWTTTDLKNAIASQNPKGPYDVVSLLIGVNDQYQWHDTTGYRQRFFELLSKSIQLAGGHRDHVFVLSIPDYSVTPFGMNDDTALIRLQIDQFNAINKEVTAANNCHYLDITPSTREAANDPTLVAGDGLHPSGREYKRWSDRLAPMMKTALQ